MRSMRALFTAAAIVLMMVTPQWGVSAKGAPASSSIAVAAGSQLQLGGLVTFDYVVGKVPKSAVGYVNLGITCYQPNGLYAWATAGYPDSVFKLGGSWSNDGVWLEWGEGIDGHVVYGWNGPVHCVASLYYFNSNNMQVFIASTEFDAAGA